MVLMYILAFVGILVGLFLAHLARDELKSGKKYFILIYRILLFILIIYLLYLSEINWWLLGIIFGFIFSIFFSELYFFLGLAVFSSLNVYVAFITFLIGLPYGTLLYTKKGVKNYLIYALILFFIPALILLVNIPSTFVYAFIIGALFSLFLRKF
jgi:hypothetical protein